MEGSISSRTGESGPTVDFVALMKPLPEPHLLVSAGGEILASNAAAWRELAIDPGAAGTTLAVLVRDPPARVEAFLTAASRSNNLIPGAFTFRVQKGQEKRFGCAGGLVQRAAAGNPALILLRFRPHEQTIPGFLLLNERIEQLTRALHERRLAQNDLQAHSARLRELAEELERQKNDAQAADRAKSKFLAAMSHELRTPLNGILGFVDLLDFEVQGPINDRQRNQLQKIRRSTDHLVTIINEILDYSRNESAHAEQLRLECVDLVEIAREAIEMIEPAFIEADLELVRELPSTPVAARTDAVKVRQILLNLLSNAVKFTHSGSARITIEEQEDRVAISVADTGIGIDPDDFEHIFEPFWQRHRGRGGTGLGLPVTRNLARRLGGDVEVESAPGKGSTFTLVLAGAAQ